MKRPEPAPGKPQAWRLWRLRRLLGLLISAGGIAILVNEAMLQVLR